MKRLESLAIVLVFVALGTGCSPKPDTQMSKEAEATQQEITHDKAKAVDQHSESQPQAVVMDVQNTAKADSNQQKDANQQEPATLNEVELNNSLNDSKSDDGKVDVHAVKPKDMAKAKQVDQQKATTDRTNKLQQEAIVFVQALDIISQEVMKQQSIVNQKMQQASSRADDDAVTQMTIDLLTKQKSAISAIPVTEPKLDAIRNKLIESVNMSIEANQEMIKIRQPTSEDEQKLVAKFTKSRQLSEEAKSDLRMILPVGK